MLQRRIRSALLAACAAPVFAFASSAMAGTDPLITTGTDESGNTFVQVNGTAGNDTIVMGSLGDGGILVIRISRGIAIGYISSSLVQTQNIVVFAGDGNDTVDASAVAPGASMEIHGGNGDDTITGSQGSDSLFGEDGNDTIQGGPGAGFDIIDGGNGFWDRLYAGAGGAAIIDEDGVAVARGSDSVDSIGIIFSAAWVNPQGQRRLINKISAGGENDDVFIAVDGDPILFAVDGDGQGTTNPGDADSLTTVGNIDINSTFVNFEIQ